MRKVEVRLAARELGSRMARMRLRLDGRRFERNVFRYSIAGGLFASNAEFKCPTKALALAAALGGPERSPGASVRDGRRTARMRRGGGSGGAGFPPSQCLVIPY
jgi:hypothetical protein